MLNKIKTIEVMKKYVVTRTTNVDAYVEFESTNEQEARAYFEKIRKSLSKNEAEDIAGWQDDDNAWKYVYTYELEAREIDEDGEWTDFETLDQTPYYDDGLR
jgi:hypothetical protein